MDKLRFRGTVMSETKGGGLIDKELAGLVRSESEFLGNKVGKDKGQVAGKQVENLFGFETTWEVVVPLILTGLGFLTRFYKIGLANKVVWDEAHFGKFGNYYIQREFYHDVHPPLGKMLIGLSGFLAGNNGTFLYDSGSTYPPDVNYTFQRCFAGLFGVALIPLAYFTALNLKLTRKASLLVGSMVLFDNALCVISRFILLDSMLLCFTALAFFFLTGFHNQQTRPFSLGWWVWLFGTGVSLGLASSVKWVGLFVVALVGVYTIQDLYDKFGDVTMAKDQYLTHWVARIVALIITPFVVYMLCFLVHFTILNHSGPGDSTMSSLFQARLLGSKIGRGPSQVAFGSRVTIKNNVYGGGLLHSHPSLYPSGSRQHQVTIYHHSDSNNNWVFLRDHEQSKARRESNSAYKPPPAEEPGEEEGLNTYLDEDENLNEPVRFVKDGDTVRLLHSKTGANLHSHKLPAPISDKDYEVSGYLNRTMGDSNDYWVVEIRDDLTGNTNGNIHLLSTRFRLRHKNLGCYLIATGNRLPPWGFGQGEISCRSDIGDIANALWNIEDHNNLRLIDLPSGLDMKHNTFLRDFVHLNVAMWNTNNALVPDEDKDDILASKPYHWPLMLKGIRMCGWGDDDIKFYMLGNPLVWWSSTLSLLILMGSMAYYLVRFQRGYREWYKRDWLSFVYTVQTILTGYFLQYLPYYIMGRVMYVHHYFPALYFACFAPAYLLDLLLANHKPSSQLWIFTSASLVLGIAFFYFSPITFGMGYPARQAQHLNWISSWKMAN